MDLLNSRKAWIGALAVSSEIILKMMLNSIQLISPLTSSFYFFCSFSGD